jgi:simple sugar transport system substrate-binding protein
VGEVKKFIVILMVLMMVMSTAFAQGVKNIQIGNYTFKVDTGKALKDREIVMVYSNAASQFGALVRAGIDKAAKDFSMHAYMSGGTEWGSDQEIKIMEDVIAKKVDGIGVGVLDITALAPYIKQALEAGIPVVCYNGDAPNSGRLGYAGADYIEQGYQAAKSVLKKIAEKYPNGGTVLCTGTALQDQIQQYRDQGLKKAYAEYPKLKLRFVYQNCPGDDTAVYSTLENLFLANKDKNIVGWVEFGNTGILLSRILKDNNYGNVSSNHPVYNTSADIYQERVQQIIDGWATSVWSQDPFMQGYLPVQQFKNFFTNYNSASFKVESTKVYGVDASNATEYLKKIEAGEPIG